MKQDTVGLLQTIERLRSEMIDAYLNSKTGLSHPEVLRISQLLDIQLNHLDVVHADKN